MDKRREKARRMDRPNSNKLLNMIFEKEFGTNAIPNPLFDSQNERRFRIRSPNCRKAATLCHGTANALKRSRTLTPNSDGLQSSRLEHEAAPCSSPCGCLDPGDR
ncbi:hypothetical protein CEXT_493571 [Caerostris extrusa]|uniref:Uncharacterized protein n=1 Tax=Caerostris extrusa TaxID=172846 RepID=A0AAV4N1L6_CAEEX|nr:hypothetical protein CEXT_493571 [Caerostris extrusa]